MGKKTNKRANTGASGAPVAIRGRAARRRAARLRYNEQERAQEIGFLALATEVAQENAEALRLLAKH